MEPELYNIRKVMQEMRECVSETHVTHEALTHPRVDEAKGAELNRGLAEHIGRAAETMIEHRPDGQIRRKRVWVMNDEAAQMLFRAVEILESAAHTERGKMLLTAAVPE